MERVDVPLVVLGQAHEIFELLVRRDPPHKQDVCQSVLQHPFERGPRWCLGQTCGVDGNGEHSGVDEPQRVQLATVVFGVPEGEVHTTRQPGQFLPSPRDDRRRACVVRCEKMGRRDVVILDDAAAG